MTGKKPSKANSSNALEDAIKSHDEMLPGCAAVMATVTEQLRQVVSTQEKIVETVWGNGKKGLNEKVDDNKRVIDDIAETLKQSVEARKIEIDERKKEVADRKKEMRTWWLGLVATLIVMIIGAGVTIATSLSTQAALKALNLTP